MEVIKDIQQGTDEWLSLRLGKATASNFSKIITSRGELSKSLEKYALELASQVLATDLEQGFKSESMQRGNDLEPLAREAYQEYTFNIVDEVAFLDCGDWGYSPDGLIGKDGVVEFKCPQATTHTKYLFDDKLPTEYKAQVQGGLMVSERQWCDFVSFHPNFKEERLFIKRVERDEDFIGKLRDGIGKVIELRNKFINKIKAK